MNYNKKVTLTIIMSLCELFIITKDKSHSHDDQISLKNNIAINLILEMEKSITLSDQDTFKKLLVNYINQFGTLYKKEKFSLTTYATVYYMTSQDDDNQPITLQEKTQLLNILNQATLQPKWHNSLSIDLPVINLKTLQKNYKQFTLLEIINAIKEFNNQITTYTDTKEYTLSAYAMIILGTIAIGSGLYKITENKEFFLYTWQDFNTSMNQIKKYFTTPQNYLQFEKEHNLLSENMTVTERQQRFLDWQTGEKIQQKINKQMMEIEQFEKKMGLPSDNMLIKDRIKIFKDWKKQEQILNKIDQKYRLIEQFEQKHNLTSENMSEESRQKRCKAWQALDKQQKYIDKIMIEVQAFENKMELPSDNMDYQDRIKIFNRWQIEQNHEKMIMSMILWEDENKDDHWLMEKEYNYKTGSWENQKQELSEDERIARYLRQTNPLQRIVLENQNTIKAVEAFEKKLNLPTQNMYYQDRVKIFSQWRQEQIKETAIKGMSAWEQKFNISTASKRPILIEMNKQDRINRYYNDYPWKFWKNPSIKDLEKFEADKGYSTMKETDQYETMTDDERLRRYEKSTSPDERFFWESFGFYLKFM